MQSLQTRANLERCRDEFERLDVPDELRQLSADLLEHLLNMHDDGRLSTPVFMLAADSLELVPGLGESVGALRAAASRELT